MRWLAGVAALAAMVQAQPQPADIILSNGKVVTVDDRFSIASAIAIRGERIVAVGSDRDVAAFAGAGTRRIDLGGRTVIPGLIDNHMHLLRAGTTWQYEVRLDGVDIAEGGAGSSARPREDNAAGRMDLHARRLGDGAVRR